MEQSNYMKYRGKCKEMVEDLVKKHDGLVPVRGFYHCPIIGRQQHWWAQNKSGKIFDPSVKQFPSAGLGEYEEFNGICECEECGKKIKEEHAQICGPYPVCSTMCALKLVGLKK